MTKADVRREAARRQLPTAARKESQEICFIPDNDYRRFLQERFPDTVRPGPIRNLAGHVLGQHSGLARFTIGQRKGLGLSGRPEPFFVIALDPADNAVIVGPEDALQRSSLEVSRVHMVSGEWPAAPLRLEAKVRYRASIAAAWLTPLEKGRARLDFDRPQRAVTPGQAAVFYDGEEVLGGGIIL
jgi:tRNA-specific 2-thiouridylase